VRSDYVELLALVTLGTHTLMIMQKEKRKKQFLNIIPQTIGTVKVLHSDSFSSLEKATSTFNIILFFVWTSEISRFRTK
jgi:hypothetical protein